MSFKSRLSYDAAAGTYYDGDMRYIYIKPEAVMGILHALPAEMHPQVLDAMAESVFVNGGKSAQSYRAQGATEAQALLDVIEETSGQLGCGDWTLDFTEERLEVRVIKSPFADGHGPSEYPVCAPIVGMLRAVSAIIFGTKTTVTETQCAAQLAPSVPPVCIFVAVPEKDAHRV